MHIECFASANITIFIRASVNGTPQSQLWTEGEYFMRNHRDLLFNVITESNCLLEIGDIGPASNAFEITCAELLRINFADA
jgi:hypothetical protein